MTTRTRLPDRRPSKVVVFEHEGIHGYATASWFADGRLGEVFLDIGKPDSAAAIAARDAALAASLALQHGCEAKTLRLALSRLNTGRAAGPLGAALDAIGGES